MKIPNWYLTVTLLGCSPGHDRNMRIINGPNGQRFVLNESMDVWNPENDAVLDRLCAALNNQSYINMSQHGPDIDFG